MAETSQLQIMSGSQSSSSEAKQCHWYPPLLCCMRCDKANDGAHLHRQTLWHAINDTHIAFDVPIGTGAFNDLHIIVNGQDSNTVG